METTFKLVVWSIVWALIAAMVMSMHYIEQMEYAYFSWQRDALINDVRVDLKKCEWTKWPWDDNKEKVSYVPTRIVCNKNNTTNQN